VAQPLRPDSVTTALDMVFMKKRLIQHRRRRGQSLLELVAATTILAIALVPALKLIGGTIRVGRRTETANMMTTFCTSKLEEQLMKTAAVWNPSWTAPIYRIVPWNHVFF
jgi:Tfp pilus assembly protein PilV